MPPGLEKPAAVAGTEEPSSEQADAHNHGPGKQTPFVDSEGLGGQVPQNQTQQAQHHQEQLQQQHQQQPQQLQQQKPATSQAPPAAVQVNTLPPIMQKQAAQDSATWQDPATWSRQQQPQQPPCLKKTCRGRWC